MAILLEFNYAKKLGLPHFSSHNFGVSVKSEVQDPEAIPEEARRLYSVLQGSVDEQIVKPGFLPGEEKETEPTDIQSTEEQAQAEEPDPDSWHCSEKQRALILDILGRSSLPLSIADSTALHLHGRPMQQLDRRESTAVVGEILERYGRSSKERRAQ